MAILPALAVRVNPRALASQPVPTVAEVALADRLAWLADGGAPETYPGPGWDSDSRPYEPSPRELAEDAGQRIGLEGGWPTFEETFPTASARDALTCSFEFGEGLHVGHRMRARRLGFEVGVDGGPCERPESVPPRFTLDFELGWSEGDEERSWRDREMAAHHQLLDAEAEFDHRERELEHLAREAGGWDRASNLALV